MHHQAARLEVSRYHWGLSRLKHTMLMLWCFICLCSALIYFIICWTCLVVLMHLLKIVKNNHRLQCTDRGHDEQTEVLEAKCSPNLYQRFLIIGKEITVCERFPKVTQNKYIWTPLTHPMNPGWTTHKHHCSTVMCPSPSALLPLHKWLHLK